MHVKRTVRRERSFSKLETDADVQRESFKARLTERPQRAADQMKVHAVINITKSNEEDRAQDDFSGKTIIICR